MTRSRTASALARLVAPLRRLSLLAWLAAGLGAIALLFALLAWAARLGWYEQPSWVLVAWGTALVLAAGFVAAAIWRGAALTPRWLARALESGGWRRGSLRAHLEPSAPGTSEALLAAADRSAADQLERAGGADTRSLRDGLLAQVRVAGLVLLGGGVALGSARTLNGPASLLWRPGFAWRATISPLTIVSSATEVDRGGTVKLTLEALGRKNAILWLRAPGESWTGRGIRLDSLGQGAESLGPLESDVHARLTSGSHESATILVRVRIPAFLGSLSVTAHYPRYLHLEDEPISTAGDTVLLPAGTRLETRGEATAALATAEWVAGPLRTPLEVDGARFGGAFAPSMSRTYTLSLETANRGPLAGDTVRLSLVVVPDRPPEVEVPVPGADTVAPLSLRVPLVVDVKDDHGVQRVTVESRRISRLGFEDPARIETVALPPGTPDRAILPFELDLNQRGLLPGDTIRYFVRASDNAPESHSARSQEYVLRLPTLTEVRAAARQASEAVAGRLDSITAASRQLERQTEDLAQERSRDNPTGKPGSTNESLSYEQAKKAETVAANQEQLLQQAEAIKQALDALKQSAEAAGLNDPEWQQRLEEIRNQLDRALTPELREKLAELQRALKDLDAERTKEALTELAEAQKQLREALERSKELFRRAAVEGDLANLTSEAKELARQQQEWTNQVPAADSARAAVEERQLSQRADSLSAALNRLAGDLKQDGREQQMGQMSQQASQAAGQMRQASQSAKAGQRQQAKQQGEQASKSLDPLGEQLQEERKDLQQEWRSEVTDALDLALGDASRLAERQLQVADALRRGDTSPAIRAQQGALEEGTEKLLEQLKDVSGKNALVSAQSSVALATAKDQMRRAREALASVASNPREAGERAGEAVDALDAAAYSLFRSRGDVSGAESGSGLSEAMERMGQLASQQGQLGQQSGGLLPMAGAGGAVQQQLRHLGAQQRALAEELERLRAGGNMPGAGEMSQEAKELARQLEAGRLDRQTVERQERLFRRMLDAGRTLQGREEDEKKERQSTTATDDSIHLPPALRAKLSDDDLLRVPSWEALQGLSPEERRLVVEYFRRLAETRSSVSEEK